jgi:hypothetical protein
MDLSATTIRSTDAVGQRHTGAASAGARLGGDLTSARGIDLDVDLGAGPAVGTGADGGLGSNRVDADEQDPAESVVVHVQLRPRRPAVRKCLAALTALAAQHPAVAFDLTGLSQDDRVVRVTVGIDLGPRAEVAKFSAAAQAAYLFVDGLFTSLYDYMPVYVAEPSAAEQAAAVGVLAAVSAPRPFIPTPRRGEPDVPPAGSPARADRRAVPVPA